MDLIENFMEAEKLLKEIQKFKENLREYRVLTEGHVETWGPDTDIDEQLHPSEADEISYETLKSELGQKFILFGDDLKNKIRVVTRNSGGKIINERNGISSILTLSDNLKDERLKINQFNFPDSRRYKKTWSIVLHGIEKYIGKLKYFDEKQADIIERESELERKESELASREEGIKSLKKVYEELVHIKRGLPEIIRSEVAKEIKVQHRGIEKYTNPDTKSQQKKKE